MCIKINFRHKSCHHVEFRVLSLNTFKAFKLHELIFFVNLYNHSKVNKCSFGEVWGIETYIPKVTLHLLVILIFFH